MKKFNFFILAIVLFSLASLLASFVLAVQSSSMLSVSGNVVSQDIDGLSLKIDNSLSNLEGLKISENELIGLLEQDRKSYDEMARLMYGLGDVFGSVYENPSLKDYFYNEGNKIELKLKYANSTEQEIKSNLENYNYIQEQLDDFKKDIVDIKKDISKIPQKESNFFIYAIIAINFITLIVSLVLAKNQIVNVNIFGSGKHKVKKS